MKVIFTRSNSAGCKVVRAIDGGEWSHCAIALPADPYGPDRCVEAVWPGGVRIRSLNALLAARPEHMVLELDLPEVAARRETDAAAGIKTLCMGEAFAASRQGMAYDWAALPSLALRRVFGTGPRLASDKRWYCAELVLAACAASGAPLDGPLRRYGVQAAFKHCWNLQR